MTAGKSPQLRSLILGGLLGMDVAGDLVKQHGSEAASAIASIAVGMANGEGRKLASREDVEIALRERRSLLSAVTPLARFLAEAEADAATLIEYASESSVRQSSGRELMVLAEAILAAKNDGASNVEIARFLKLEGLDMSEVHVGDQLKLARAPSQVRSRVRDGDVRPTAVIRMTKELARDGADPMLLIPIVERGILVAKADGLNTASLPCLHKARIQLASQPKPITELPGSTWTASQVNHCVAAYTDMLQHELAGQSYVKATYNEQVRLATGRSKGAVELKFANVSAVLDEMGLRWLKGYLPREHGQAGAIRDALEAYLVMHQGFADRLEEVPTAVPQLPSVADNVFTLPPPPSPLAQPGDSSLLPSVQKRDRALSDSRNRALGEKGEEWVMTVERQRLNDEGRPDLALKVIHTAKDEGDGAGYDIASFNADDSPRLIEVKTTNGPSDTAFYVTVNEVRRSAEKASIYWLYRVYGFSKEPRIYTLQGALDGNGLKLEPTVYRARR
ncbi:DUF3883 domain-containing protein [Falsiroseomonas sp. HC035]|uniref:DUF3883 domain-containing protein n=1 Tax=Falsiroseomonas sp. HC035 TaxID=3390999 RepID=UPI003D3177B6